MWEIVKQEIFYLEFLFGKKILKNKKKKITIILFQEDSMKIFFKIKL
jgi:hypothetical protein